MFKIGYIYILLQNTDFHETSYLLRRAAAFTADFQLWFKETNNDGYRTGPHLWQYDGVDDAHR